MLIQKGGQQRNRFWLDLQFAITRINQSQFKYKSHFKSQFQFICSGLSATINIYFFLLHALFFQHILVLVYALCCKVKLFFYVKINVYASQTYFKKEKKYMTRVIYPIRSNKLTLIQLDIKKNIKRQQINPQLIKYRRTNRVKMT